MKVFFINIYLKLFLQKIVFSKKKRKGKEEYHHIAEQKKFIYIFVQRTYVRKKREATRRHPKRVKGIASIFIAQKKKGKKVVGKKRNKVNLIHGIAS